MMNWNLLKFCSEYCCILYVRKMGIRETQMRRLKNMACVWNVQATSGRITTHPGIMTSINY